MLRTPCLAAPRPGSPRAWAGPSERRLRLRMLGTGTRSPGVQPNPPGHSSPRHVACAPCGVRAGPLGPLYRLPAVGQVITSGGDGRGTWSSASRAPTVGCCHGVQGGGGGAWSLLSRSPHRRSWRNAITHQLDSPAGLHRRRRMNLLSRANCVTWLRKSRLAKEWLVLCSFKVKLLI
jgi:hypothetical protein